METGVEATRRIRKEHPPEKLRVIVLTTFDHDDIVLAALRAGANGFLSKTMSPAELVAGITEVVGGGDEAERDRGLVGVGVGRAHEEGDGGHQRRQKVHGISLEAGPNNVAQEKGFALLTNAKQ